jgi:hypothetical protein
MLAKQSYAFVKGSHLRVQAMKGGHPKALEETSERKGRSTLFDVQFANLVEQSLITHIEHDGGLFAIPLSLL